MLRLIFIELFIFSTLGFGQIYNFAVLGDAGYWNHHTEQIQRSIDESNVQTLILPGDNLYNTHEGYDSVWSHWTNFNLSIVAIGNHTLGYHKEVEYFKMPGEYYSKTYGEEIRFIILNSDNEHNVEVQLEFLEKELSQAQENFIFLVYHHPSYTISFFHNWEEKKQFQNGIRHLLKKYNDKISGILNGHDHIASLISLDHIPLIVSGATHEVRPASPLNTVATDGVHVKTQYLGKFQTYWTRLDIDTANNSMDVSFIRGKDGKTTCSINIKEQNIKPEDNCRFEDSLLR